MERTGVGILFGVLLVKANSLGHYFISSFNSQQEYQKVKKDFEDIKSTGFFPFTIWEIPIFPDLPT